MDLRGAPRATSLSLAYLALFGSVFAFGAYLTLLKRVGAGPSSFVGVATPVIALALSTLFEGYRWTWVGAVGVVLAVPGNWLALRGSLGVPTPRLLAERTSRGTMSAVLGRGRALRPLACSARYSKLSFASMISFFQCARSRSMIAPSCSGVPGTSSAPSRSRRSRTSGCASTFCISALRRATIARGVPAGATMPQ